jgi:outer membrane protein TolC
MIAVCCAISLNAQSLEECRQLARDNYPEIKQYNLIAASEEFNLANAAKAWLPQIVVSGQVTLQSATPTYPERFSDMMSAYGIEMTGLHKDQYKIAVDVSQNIWDGGVSKANTARIKAEADGQRRQVDVALYDLNGRVDQLYFSILLLDKRVALAQNMISVLDSNLKFMKSLHKNGVALRADVDAVEAELLTAKQSLKQIESSRKSYRNMLAIFIGRKLSDETLALPNSTAINGRESFRPELAMFDAQSRVLKTQRDALQASLMPKFSAFAQGYYGYPGMDMFKDMMSRRWSLNAIIGLRVSWNISAYYTKNRELAKIDIAQHQIDVQRDIFQFNTRLKTVQDDAEIARLQETLESDKRIVELRRSVRMAAESKLKNGIINVTDLIQKINDENTAEINKTTHEIELLQTIYRLKNTLNQ